MSADAKDSLPEKNSQTTDDDLPEQLRIRREKRSAILARGIDPYPVDVPRTTSLKDVRERFSGLEIDVATGVTESLTGRIIFKRDTGNWKDSFICCSRKICS